MSVHETWKAMVILKEAGLTKNVGVCNMNVHFTSDDTRAQNKQNSGNMRLANLLIASGICLQKSVLNDICKVRLTHL